ncbi:MAG TPA: DNA topoisomerase [Lachnospiraceae bacterium]|nr:toprim domain-containing protein [uncultured Lachnoclostridium sp.]HAU85128.1 DNA topoisomerase [Lachnospiraceae bacterium]
MSKDTIKQLDTRQQCREKLPIFFGSRDNFIHGAKEVIANAIDEITNNFSSGEIEVRLFEDNRTVQVKDTGRGVPIDGKTGDKPNYVLLFETLFAGTNYDNNENNKIAVGTNGCGTCVLNHTSKLFKVTSSRNGVIHEVCYEDGGRFKGFSKVGECDQSYSIFEFRLDEEVYTNVVYNPAELREICKYNSAVNNKVTITFLYGDEENRFHYDSIEEYFDEITSSLTAKKVLGNEKEFNDVVEVHEGVAVAERNIVSLVLSTSGEPVQQTFLNSNYLPNNGSIYDGVVAGARLAVNKYCKDNKLLDKKIGAITKEDIEESISFVCSVLSTNVEYENQIKLSTQKKLYKTVAQEYVKELLEVMMIEQPKEFEKIVKHILEVQKFNSKAQANKKALKKKLSEKIDNISNRVEGLVDCKLQGQDSELFIAEGRSALGSIVLARNPRNQAAIPIRGKILNCLKADYDTIFKNEIISDLVKTLGCGIETDKKNKELGTFDINNLRYGKVLLATDMDSDGYNIQCLLLTMFYRLMPTLIYEGRIYLVKTPLYEVKMKNGDVIYWFSETEKEEAMARGLEIKSIARAKGLGELDAEVMSQTGVHPDTRNVVQVTVDDVKEMQEAFRIWMDTEVTDRKKIVETELHKYELID